VSLCEPHYTTAIQRPPEVDIYAKLLIDQDIKLYLKQPIVNSQLGEAFPAGPLIRRRIGTQWLAEQGFPAPDPVNRIKPDEITA
jgi:hypothetical protein